jgi:hypothetical protein
MYIQGRNNIGQKTSPTAPAEAKDASGTAGMPKPVEI